MNDMNHETASLDEFMASAKAVLAETTLHLQKLTQLALLNESAFANGHEQAAPLKQVRQQLVSLTERSQALQDYLQHGLAAPLTNDNQWPLIKILQSQEEERTQLARELEDNLGQLLANAVFELASCRHLLVNDKESVSTGLDALQLELEQGLADVRWFIAELEPATLLGNFGLGGGVRRYLERYEQRTGLATQFNLKTNLGRLPSIIEVAIFRVIQEALSNVYYHANATRVEVVVEENDRILHFNVIDNGRGLMLDDLGKSRKNFGLARMVDYAELLNGKLKVWSEPGQGTQVSLLMPYPIL